jgi:hypothetical protein
MRLAKILRAAIKGKDPNFSEIINNDFVPEHYKDWDDFNEMIYQKYKNKDWKEIYTDWKNTFTIFIQLAEKITEEIYLMQDKYKWMNGYALLKVLNGSVAHHNDHWINVKTVMN